MTVPPAARGRGARATQPTLASRAQRQLMRDMSSDRRVEESKATDIAVLSDRDDLTWDQAHEIIEWLYKQPYGKAAPAASAAAAAPAAGRREMPDTDALPNITRGGGYAIEASALALAGITGVDARGNTLLFFRAKTASSGRRYMQRLTGAPGGFSTEYMPGSQATTVALAELLAMDPTGYMQAFGEHYSVCGKCGAELTDDRSRRLKLGPDCARQRGLR